jgi:hypothetical protein
MMFGLFGSRENKDSVADLLEEVVTYQQLVGHISKAQSLQKLNRFDPQHCFDAPRVFNDRVQADHRARDEALRWQGLFHHL